MEPLPQSIAQCGIIAGDTAQIGQLIGQRQHLLPLIGRLQCSQSSSFACQPAFLLVLAVMAYQSGDVLAHYKDVFVIYKISPTYDKLYQANTFGQAYCLTKGSPQWQPVNYRCCAAP